MPRKTLGPQENKEATLCWVCKMDETINVYQILDGEFLGK
jgi:hypothetical protein